MRTTLDIDNDVLEAAKELAAKEKSTAGQVISTLARKGLNLATKPEHLRGGVPVLPSRGDVISVEHIRKLMDQENV